MSEKDLFLAHFRNLNGHGPSWLQPLRASAFQRFADVGFPTTHLEDWKYTNVAPLARVPFRFGSGAAPDARIRAAVERHSLKSGGRLVFLDGRLVVELSALPPVPAGVKVCGLAQALENDPAAIEPHLTRYARPEGQSFVALNTAFLTDGAFVHVPRGVAVEAPIQILFLSAGTGGPSVSHPRSLVVVEESGQVDVVEAHVGLGADTYFANSVTEIVVGADARVAHCKLQQESEAAFHVASVVAHQGRASRLRSCSLSFGGALVRNDINTTLDGEGGESTLDGLYLASGRQHVDHHTSIDHQRPHCSSFEVYKGVLDGHSSGVFNGKVIVRPDAQKSDARQVNNNLLLSEDALINTKPQLEIFADDVRCSHGATIGRLEADALFYLRSRAIDEATARSLLIYGFANEIVERLQNETVRRHVEQTLWARFAGELASEALR